MAQYVSITIAAICTAHAGAQSGELLVEVSNAITPQTPTATVSIYAQVGAPLPSYGIGGALFDLFASEPSFADVTYIYQNPPLGGPYLPTNHGNWLEGVETGQTFPSQGPIQVPYLLLSVEWEASAFEPRTVNLWTDNILHFSTFTAPQMGNLMLIPNPINGSATIQIIPAPWSALALFAGASMLGARRRRR
ncbi:MAG: hypothetical protein H6815_02845 [Phycisphaeraceae bacterium]|nr:hypothetical protein [Phycisphaerales bacterium]MCB9859364.1 hypothetical protein [Phycisphaeraceae bacterium]